MKGRNFFLVLLAALALAVPAAMIKASTALADSTTMYHFSDNSTGACTDVTFPQDNWFDNQVGPPNHVSENTALKFISEGGVFGVGWVATGQVDVIPSYLSEFENLYVGGPSLNPTGDPEGDSGGPYTAVAFYTLATGACPITEAMVQTDNINGCASAPVWRADGTYGLFVTVDEGYLQSMMFEGVTFTPAYYFVGVGNTCDMLSGYHASGKMVDELDATGNGGSIYPEYVRNS